MERKLASIQKVIEIKPIENSDNIELAVIKGWQCIVMKGDCKVGDLVLYIEIDSVLSERPEFEFLRKRCWVDNTIAKGFRIRSMKLRGVISQGIIFPLRIFNLEDKKEGEDVTELLGVTKYEQPESVEIKKDEAPKRFFKRVIWEIKRRIFPRQKRGLYPSWAPKSDEERGQNCPEIIENYKGELWVGSEKLDGSSSTFAVKDNKFYACSRTMIRGVSRIIKVWRFKWSRNDIFEDSIWTKIAIKYNLKEKLFSLNRNIAMFGEIIGPKIQGNKYKLSEFRFYSFGAFDIDKQKYLNYKEWIDLMTALDLEIVPILIKPSVIYETMDVLIKEADGESCITEGVSREGIVYRLADDKGAKISFKVVSNKFLLEHGE